MPQFPNLYTSRRCVCHFIKAPYSSLWDMNDSVMRETGEGLLATQGRPDVQKVPPHVWPCLLLTHAACLVG